MGSAPPKKALRVVGVGRAAPLVEAVHVVGALREVGAVPQRVVRGELLLAPATIRAGDHVEQARAAEHGAPTVRCG